MQNAGRSGRHRCALVRDALRVTLFAVFAGVAAAGVAAEPGGALTFNVVADGIPEAFGSGDPARGRALLAARDPANCVMCHAVPGIAIPFAGDLGPALAGAGTRFDSAQLRLRVADNMRVNPATIMPSYYRIEGFDRVAPAYRDKPILTAREVDDVVAYLATLR